MVDKQAVEQCTALPRKTYRGVRIAIFLTSCSASARFLEPPPVPKLIGARHNLLQGSYSLSVTPPLLSPHITQYIVQRRRGREAESRQLLHLPLHEVGERR